MTTVNIELRPGTFIAGINRPFFVTESMVRSKLQKDYGLTGIHFYPRKSPPVLPNAPAGINPKVDPYYDNDWDEWLVGHYSGPPRTVPKVKKVWAWLTFIPEGQQLPKTPLPPSVVALIQAPPTKSTTGSTGGAPDGETALRLIFALAIGGLVYLGSSIALSAALHPPKVK